MTPDPANYTCPVCLKQLPWAHSFAAHMKAHRGTPSPACDSGVVYAFALLVERAAAKRAEENKP